jgi:predicted transcriptional regulator
MSQTLTIALSDASRDQLTALARQLECSEECVLEQALAALTEAQDEQVARIERAVACARNGGKRYSASVVRQMVAALQP